MTLPRTGWIGGLGYLWQPGMTYYVPELPVFLRAARIEGIDYVRNDVISRAFGGEHVLRVLMRNGAIYIGCRWQAVATPNVAVRAAHGVDVIDAPALPRGRRR